MKFVEDFLGIENWRMYKSGEEVCGEPYSEWGRFTMVFIFSEMKQNVLSLREFVSVGSRRMWLTFI